MSSIIKKQKKLEESDSWDKKRGVDRIKSFLQECSESKNSVSSLVEYEYFLKYAERYTLIKRRLKSDSNSPLQLDNYGIELKNVLEEGDEVKIALNLKKIMLKNKEGCGSWVVNEDIIMNEQFYVFEADSNNDTAYKYALFLHDLGIIETFRNWKRHENGLYYCKRTNLGQELSRIMKIEFLKTHSSQIFEDNSINNSGLMTGGVTAGKNNYGK